MNNIIVSAPCKIHLLGEHSAVYGKPALLTALDKRCAVKIARTASLDITITSNITKYEARLNYESVIETTKQARSEWKKYIATNDVVILKKITEDALDYAIIAIGETFLYYNQKPASGFSLRIDSEIPTGAGLGSSASLAAATIGAVSLFLGKPFDREVINNISYQVEMKRHGLPSGGDNATVCFGGLIWYRKETEGLKIIMQPIATKIPENVSQNFFIINTGTPVESTGEMVGYVRKLRQEHPEIVEAFLREQEHLTRELVSVLNVGNEKELIRIIREGQKNLEWIGVVSDFSKEIIREIESKGGAAKICGGGGKEKGTGVLLVYHTDPVVVSAIAKEKNVSFFQIQLGAEGVRKDA